jgi:hypothetical protein
VAPFIGAVRASAATHGARSVAVDHAVAPPPFLGPNHKYVTVYIQFCYFVKFCVKDAVLSLSYKALNDPLALGLSHTVIILGHTKITKTPYQRSRMSTPHARIDETGAPPVSAVSSGLGTGAVDIGVPMATESRLIALLGAQLVEVQPIVS